MIAAEAIKAIYRQACRETVAVRRFTGSGSNRPYTDVSARGRVLPPAEAKALIANIQQHERAILILVEDLVSGGFSLPLTHAEKVVVEGTKELALAIHEKRTALDGTLIAYVVKAA